MEKLQKILRIVLILACISVLTTIQLQLINSDGLNLNLSGKIDSNNSLNGNLKLDTSLSGYINSDISGTIDTDLSGGINTYEQN